MIGESGAKINLIAKSINPQKKAMNLIDTIQSIQKLFIFY